MSTLEQYQAIVIGSGQGGNPLCGALAGAGLRTALVERKHIGGTCINEGCTPTKTMVASGRVAYLARRGADYGVRTGSLSVDLEKVRQRKRAIVDSFRGGGQARLEKTANLELIFGEARFTGPRSVQVRLNGGGERTLAAERIFINAGARPAVPALDGLQRRTVPGQHVHYGIGGSARAPAGVGRGLCGAGVRADVPPFRQPRDHRPFRAGNC